MPRIVIVCSPLFWEHALIPKKWRTNNNDSWHETSTMTLKRECSYDEDHLSYQQAQSEKTVRREQPNAYRNLTDDPMDQIMPELKMRTINAESNEAPTITDNQAYTYQLLSTQKNGTENNVHRDIVEEALRQCFILLPIKWI